MKYTNLTMLTTPCTKHIMSSGVKALVQSMCDLMMKMNTADHEDRTDLTNPQNANGYDSNGTYGHLSRAIIALVLNETGYDITDAGGRYGWNLGGNSTYADDIQAVLDHMHDERVPRAYLLNITTHDEYSERDAYESDLPGLFADAQAMAAKTSQDNDGAPATVAVINFNGYAHLACFTACFNPAKSEAFVEALFDAEYKAAKANLAAE